jgi:Co/Zn/Cd efflux system component
MFVSKFYLKMNLNVILICIYILSSCLEAYSYDCEKILLIMFNYIVLICISLYITLNSVCKSMHPNY